MSEINTTPRHTKDWTVDDDSDDDVEELARQLGTPSRSKLQQQDREREAASPPPSASGKEDKPVASLLSRIGGLSTDAEPFTPSSPSSAPKDHSQPTTQRPKPNLSNPLFGKALAGISAPKKAPEASQQSPKEEKAESTPAPAAGLSIKSRASSSQRGQELLGSEPSTQGRMTTDDGGWGPDSTYGGNEQYAPPTNGGEDKKESGSIPDTTMSESDKSGLISNDFQVEVKLADLQADENSPLYSVKTFEDLPLAPDLLKGVYAVGFKKPSKIQEKALPMLLNNPPRNLIGQSQSGTGKTAAFALNMLSRIEPTIMAPQAICLAPSRELARQIQVVFDSIGQFTHIKSRLAVPKSWSPRERITEHVLIGTPGTIQDMLRRPDVFDPKLIRVLVLDEADEMIGQQGLGDQTSRIKKMLPVSVQNVLFSATFPDTVQQFAAHFAPEANQIFLKKEDVTVEAIKQLYLECDGEDQKYNALSLLYDCMSIGQSIVFCRRKDTADRIANRLNSEGHSVASLHGEKQGDERDAILDGFRDGKTKVLITTNVVARGIDIQQVNMVVNYDVPIMGPEGQFRPDIETYIHRIGRTGRFGRKGCSVIFAHDSRSKEDVQEIIRELGKPMKQIDASSRTDLDQLEKALKAAMKGPN